jgi:predicted ATP-binding protein involved in virulence
VSPQTHLRVDRLSLRNFRCFAECAIDLHPELTVLVAENGRGKTAILDAIRIALIFFVDTITDTRPVHGFKRTDIRLVPGDNGMMVPVLPTAFMVQGYAAGQAMRWNRALNGDRPRSRTTTNGAGELRRAAQEFREGNAQAPATGRNLSTLPLVAFYGTDRLWSEHWISKEKRRAAEATRGRLEGYTDCLSPAASFKSLVSWYESKANEIRDPRFSVENTKNLRLLAAVKEATRAVLEPTQWRDLDWNFEQKSLVVQHPDYGRLPLSALSDGVRNTIALAADIARRCVTLNPHLDAEAARQTPGVLLIDEVDLHLHPKWQQQVVALLRSAFPSLQMVLTTHSPQVLSTVDKESIRGISLRDGDGLVSTPLVQTRGVESADILAEIMGVDPVPQIEEARKLSHYRALIEDGRAETLEARSMRSDLVSHFGESHPVIRDCDRLIRFQAFKLKRSNPGEL